MPIAFPGCPKNTVVMAYDRVDYRLVICEDASHPVPIPFGPDTTEAVVGQFMDHCREVHQLTLN